MISLSRHDYNTCSNPQRNVAMPDKKVTLNRFPLFGLFAYRAAKKQGYADEDARLLGFSTALLYAIFKAKSQAKKEKAEKEPKKETPFEAKTEALRFGGQDFQVVYGKGKRLKQTVVGHEIHEEKEYESQIKAKFPKGWYDKLTKAFDDYLDACEPDRLDDLFELYKPWRDQNKIGFNRVDLEKLLAWLGERDR
jgi:hypothetical protein